MSLELRYTKSNGFDILDVYSSKGLWYGRIVESYTLKGYAAVYAGLNNQYTVHNTFEEARTALIAHCIAKQMENK